MSAAFDRLADSNGGTNPVWFCAKNSANRKHFCVCPEVGLSGKSCGNACLKCLPLSRSGENPMGGSGKAKRSHRVHYHCILHPMRHLPFCLAYPADQAEQVIFLFAVTVSLTVEHVFVVNAFGGR